MTWFKVCDKFHSHPKAVKAGNEALGLWVKMGSWCSDQLTDGFVPSHVASMHDPGGEAVRGLLDAGLWEERDGGYRFHDWRDLNPTAKQVASLKKKRAAAGSKGGSKRQASAKASAGVDASGGLGDCLDGAQAKPNPDPVPDPVPDPKNDPPSPPGGNAPKRPKKPRARKPKPPVENHSDHAACVEAYFEAFKAARGVKPAFTAREGKAVNQLLDACGIKRAVQAIQAAMEPGSWPADATILHVAKDPSRYLGTRQSPSGGNTDTRAGGFAGPLLQEGYELVKKERQHDTG